MLALKQKTLVSIFIKNNKTNKKRQLILKDLNKKKHKTFKTSPLFWTKKEKFNKKKNIFLQTLNKNYLQNFKNKEIYLKDL